MGRKKKILNERKTNFTSVDSMVTSTGHLVECGSLIKVVGQHGLTFKFKCLTTNTINNIVWVDCYELHRGVAGPVRSFYPEAIKAVEKRGKRVKRSSDS